MSDNKSKHLARNVVVVQTNSHNSLLPSTISNADLLRFTGDMTKSISLAIAPSRPVAAGIYADIKLLFGSWVESGDEDKHLEELYQSRLIPSSLPDE